MTVEIHHNIIYVHKCMYINTNSSLNYFSFIVHNLNQNSEFEFLLQMDIVPVV